MIEIRKEGDEILKTVCRPIEDYQPNMQIVREIKEAFAENNVEKEGKVTVGIAAPQIGYSSRIIIVEGKVMINPVITWESPATHTDTEGCLSYPGVYVPVPRHISVRCSYTDEQGVEHQDETFTYFSAIILQHEMDHLDGVCKVGDAWEAEQQE